MALHPAKRLIAPFICVLWAAFALAVAGIQAPPVAAQGTEEGEGGGNSRGGGMEEGPGGGITTPRPGGGETFPRRITNLRYERIVSYDSRIEVQKDAGVIVTETIRVVANGRRIKRGIYRDLPLRYKTPSGLRMRVDFKILEIKRDGKPDGYHTESRSNGIRIYVGARAIACRPASTPTQSNTA